MMHIKKDKYHKACSQILAYNLRNKKTPNNPQTKAKPPHKYPSPKGFLF